MENLQKRRCVFLHPVLRLLFCSFCPGHCRLRRVSPQTPARTSDRRLSGCSRFRGNRRCWSVRCRSSISSIPQKRRTTSHGWRRGTAPRSRRVSRGSGSGSSRSGSPTSAWSSREITHVWSGMNQFYMLIHNASWEALSVFFIVGINDTKSILKSLKKALFSLYQFSRFCCFLY